ncbi:hypothetical protein B5C34_08480 [Pacificimonas flava]|uniref:Peptidase A2 domain-containing protein n=2 Tax=Pacificimonas TaxID=1960290 RepID=A0A219B5D4_9SPHN|nr:MULTISPECIES: retroviral-like aspartic protease family protein [Pacificimonas]MBZ6379301.1 retroviral-like aspartic protease family protein [Pacificimonas aurantium]OWV33491.1 hypothetical protein B5C34_08480 [Pacificimonas flava]
MKRFWPAAIVAPLLMAFDAVTPAPPRDAAAGTDHEGQNIELGEDRADRMTVDVTVNGSGPYPFVIDTGAERTMVTHELAADLGLPRGGDAFVHTISGLHKVPLFTVEELDVAGDGLVGLLAPAVEARRLGAQGLLGLDSLQNSRVRFDMRDGIMTVEPSAVDQVPARYQRGVITITAERRLGRMILTEARLNGVRVKVVLDTGAQVTVANEALREALLRRAKEQEGVELVGVLGDSLQGELAHVRRLEIDKILISGGALVFSDAPVFAQLDLAGEPAILLGMSMLRSFDSVMVDFPNRLVAFDLPRTSGIRSRLARGCRATRIDPDCT